MAPPTTPLHTVTNLTQPIPAPYHQPNTHGYPLLPGSINARRLTVTITQNRRINKSDGATLDANSEGSTLPTPEKPVKHSLSCKNIVTQAMNRPSDGESAMKRAAYAPVSLLA